MFKDIFSKFVRFATVFCEHVACVSGQSYSRSMGDGRKVLASCETYDPVSDTWTLESNMLAARCLFDAVVV